jgi:hypothetical protein
LEAVSRNNPFGKFAVYSNREVNTDGNLLWSRRAKAILTLIFDTDDEMKASRSL